MKLYEALEKYEPKRLITGRFERDGDCCAIGAYLKVTAPNEPIEGMSSEQIWEKLKSKFKSLSIIWIYQANDDLVEVTPEERYQEMLSLTKEQDI